MHDVLIPLVPGYQPLDVVGPHEVFAAATALLTRDGNPAGHHIRLAAAAIGSVPADSGLGLAATETFPEHGPIGTLLVPGGFGVRRTSRDAPEFVAWLPPRRSTSRPPPMRSARAGEPP